MSLYLNKYLKDITITLKNMVFKQSRKYLHKYQSIYYLPLCCCLASADSRFMSVTVTFCVRAGELGWSGQQGGAADVMREGQGEGHGEGWGDA